LAKDSGFELLMLNLAHFEEGDLIGIPYREGEAMLYAIPEWLYTNRNKKCILFLDEIDRAPKNILNSCLSLIREYRIHTHYLPDNWKIIAAGNSGINDSFYDTSELDFALKSRFIHLFYELTTLEWLEWAEKNNIHPYIKNYLKIEPSALIVEPENNEVFSYPNPRTWEILSQALYITPSNLWKFVIIGTIGKEIGESFYIFIKRNDKGTLPLTFNDFVTNPKKSFHTLKNAEKTLLIDTVSNLGNNIENIFKEYKTNNTFEILGKILGILILLEHFELSAMLFNSIEGMKDGYKYTKAILNSMQSNPQLNELLITHKNKISILYKNNT
jgi:hypothetical protein